MSWYVATRDPWARLELPAPLTVANDETGEIIVRFSFHDVFEQTQDDSRLLGRIARALGPSVLLRWEDGDESLDLAAEVAAVVGERDGCRIAVEALNTGHGSYRP